MKAEPRGYQYALEPLRSKCNWELQEMQQTLAGLLGKIDETSWAIEECQSQLAAASAELSRQNTESQIIYPDRQNNTQAYIAQLSARLRAWRKELKELELERDDTIAKLHKLRKFSDGLDDNRDEDMKEYVKILDKSDMVEADDAWLRGMKRRKTQ